MINRAKYSAYCQCPKSVWLKNNKNDEFVSDQSVLDRMAINNQICDLECELFGKYADVTELVNDKSDVEKLVSKTSELIQCGTKVINKGSFMYDDAYCVVDILKKCNNGYLLYRTKSSTSPNRHSYIVEVAYQKYILQKCGVNIVSTYMINVNTKYNYVGRLNLKKLFKITNVDELVNEEIIKVEDNISNLKEILLMKNEPDIDLNVGCHSPHTCGFWKYCSSHLPTPSVFDLYATSIQKKIEYYRKGIVSFEDLKNTGKEFDVMQSMQIEHNLNDTETFVDKEKVKEFLDTLWYPLYFLDFETMQLGIPKYKKSKPYQPVPFQYSLHYIDQKDGEVKHKEFLAESIKDPRKTIAKRLCEDIPANACILAYNKYFERDRIRDLAKLFPRMRKKLNMIADNIIDLTDPFSAGYVYNKAMGNSKSLKSILPALYPDDPSLNYENLTGVHNGNDAMTIFIKMNDMSIEEREEVRRNLLEYCRLDTYAMVKLYEYLMDLCKFIDDKA